MKPFLLPPMAAAAAAMAVVAASILLSATTIPMASAAVVEHTFVVDMENRTAMCKEIPIVVVNGQLPGPTIEVTEGDTVIVHLVNKSPRNLTIHWHGVYQFRNCWNDGVPMLTQRPILPNTNFTYVFSVAGQEGTLWWHAHDAFLRATVYGAIVIRPKEGAASYPFPKPDKEIPILVGEWWEKDLVAVDRNFSRGFYDEFSSGSTINGKLGDLFNCSGVFEDGYVLDVEPGKTYLLRIINAALFSEYFIKLAGHKFTVVGADANYLNPYTTDTIIIAAGETMDALLVADAAPGRYYLMMQPIQAPPPDTQTPEFAVRGIVQYTTAANKISPAVEPAMPHQHDTIRSFYFHGNLTGHRDRLRARVPAKRAADEKLYITLGLGSICRHGKKTCKRGDEPTSNHMIANMNNVSFHDATVTPILEAHYYEHRAADGEGTNGGGAGQVGTAVLPNDPPNPYNYTDKALIPFGPLEQKLEPTNRGTVVRRFRYGAVVDIVFQSTAMLQGDSNPMHLHGHDMFVLGQGIGNYDAAVDDAKFNLVDPPRKNTVLVPNLGWAALRFVADNPGAWFMHCHFEFHLAMGMAAVFIIEDGPTPNTSLPPPPPNFTEGS